MKKKKQLLGLSLLLIGIALFLFPFLSMIKEDIWQSNAQRTYQQTSEKTFQKQRTALEQTTVTGAIQDIFLTKKRDRRQAKDALLRSARYQSSCGTHEHSCFRTTFRPLS